MCVYHTYPDKERLVSQSVATLGQVLNGHPVGAVAWRLVAAVLLSTQHTQNRQWERLSGAATQFLNLRNCFISITLFDTIAA